jgi:LysR family transcriptional activator of glutamate synthase operon
MHVRDLEWLLVLDELRHVTDAAAALGTSQPTVSRTLARLEDELGARLFERLPDGIHPTAAGTLVVDGARDLVRRHDQLLADLATLLDPETGVVRLAFLDSIATSLVPALLGGFHAVAPRVRVVLRQEPAFAIVDDLASGAADLAIVSPRPPGAGWLPLQEERLVVVTPPGHRLRHRSRVGVADLVGEELVTTPVGFGFRDLVDSLFRDAGAVATVTFESQDLATIVGLAQAGLGIGIVPDTVAAGAGLTGARITAPTARRTIGLAWRSDRPLTPPAAGLRAYIAGTVSA